jgi:hypothetical protein
MAAKAPLGDDIDIQIAIYDALGLLPDAVAERVKLSLEQVQERRSGRQANRIETIRAWTKDAMAERLDVEIASVDVKRHINDMSYKLIEKGLVAAHDTVDIACMECGRKPFITTAQLAAAKEGLDRTEGKALDRKSILQQHSGKVEHSYSVDGQNLSEILSELQRLNKLREGFSAPSEGASSEPQEKVN